MKRQNDGGVPQRIGGRAGCSGKLREYDREYDGRLGNAKSYSRMKSLPDTWKSYWQWYMRPFYILYNVY